MLIHSFINVIVLILLISFALNYQTKWNDEVAHSRVSLTSYLFDETEKTLDSPRHRVETIDEFLAVLDQTTRNYYSLPATSSGTFMHYLESTGEEDVEAQMHRRRPQLRVRAPRLSITFHNGTEDSRDYGTLIREVFLLKPNNRLGPFETPDALLSVHHSCVPSEDVDRAFFIPCRASSIGELFARLVHVHVKFSLYSLERGDEGEAVPVSWDVVASFTLTGHSSVMDMRASVEYVAVSHTHRVPVLIASALLVLACFDAFLRVRDICRQRRYRHEGLAERHGVPRLSAANPIPASRGDRATTGTKTPPTAAMTTTRPAAARPPSTTLLTAHEGGWKWLGLVTNAFTIAFAAVSLHRQLFCTRTFLAREQAVTLVLGFASLSSSFMLIALLKFFPAYYVLIDALLTAGRHLGLYALGVTPFLVGYAMCGTAFFGGFGPHFAHVPTALVTLVCSTFGDSLMDTFTSIDQSEYWLQAWAARLFFFTFLLLFICNVLNVAHSIIQESYSVAVSSFAAQKALTESRHSDGDDAIGAGQDMDTTGECVSPAARPPLNSREIEEMLRKLSSTSLASLSVNPSS